MEQLSNLDFLRSFTANDPAKIKKYVTMFLGFAPQSIASLRTQAAAADWKALRTTAHSLKSQVKYMGIPSAEALAIAIEKSAADESGLDEVPANIEKLADITNRAVIELQEEISKL